MVSVVTELVQYPLVPIESLLPYRSRKGAVTIGYPLLVVSGWDHKRFGKSYGRLGAESISQEPSM